MEKKEAYVHNEVILTCTSGFTTSKLIVKDRNVRISGGKLIATEEDKPSDFSCKWAGILAAAIVALLITAPFLVAILASFVAGMLFSLTAGRALCWMALQGSQWINVHKQVTIQGKKALVENSVLTCPIGGNIKIFYDKSTAQQELKNNQLKNSIEILGASFLFRGLGSAIQNNGIANGIWSFLKNTPQNLVKGYGVAEATNLLTNLATSRDWNDKLGNSIPYYGENKTFKEVVQDDYQKTSIEPIDVENETTLKTKRIMNSVETKNMLREYEQQQQNQYKQNNPIHRYRRGKKSPYFSRQKHNQQKINRQARSFVTAQRSVRSIEYEKDINRKIHKSYAKANYGLLGFFIISDIFTQYQAKTLENELCNNNKHPENVARSSVSVVAINRK